MGKAGVVAAAMAMAVTLAGCGGGGTSTSSGTGTQSSTCSPSGTVLAVSARDIKFDKGCLAAPADQPFTIRFNNKEAIPHNLAIEVAHDSPDSLFGGETITGPKTTTYKVNALKAGMYHFHCTIHPDQMQGTFIVS